MRCGGCRKELEVGDQYIQDTAGGFIGQDINPEISGLIADVLGGNDKMDSGPGAKIYYCEDCTTPGGRYLFETYWGDEDDGEE